MERVDSVDKLLFGSWLETDRSEDDNIFIQDVCSRLDTERAQPGSFCSWPDTDRANLRTAGFSVTEATVIEAFLNTHVASNVEALSLTKKALTVIDKALALEEVAAHKFGNFLGSCGCVLCLVLAAIMASCPQCLAQASGQKFRGKCNCGLWWGSWKL